MNVGTFSQTILSCVQKNKSEIYSLLRKIETAETASFEFSQVKSTLEKIATQEKFLNYHSFKRSCVFLPINLPLYSLLLYALIPGYMFEEVYIRCNKKNVDIVAPILELMGGSRLTSTYEVVSTEREVFLDGYAAVSDVIIFTGRYENAKKVVSRLPNKIIIFYGYGVNPIIIHETSELEKLADKIIDVRVFNSGQDCSAPDCIIVKNDYYDDFIKILTDKIASVKVGNINNESSRISSLLDEKNVLKLIKYLDANSEHIVLKGKIDLKEKIVYPTILKRHLSEADLFEFFSPVFNIFTYANEDELTHFLLDSDFINKSMYLSVFTKKRNFLNKIIAKHNVLLNSIIPDIDDGNKEFGGYGKTTNFVYKNYQYTHNPILISKELHQIKNYERK